MKLMMGIIEDSFGVAGSFQAARLRFRRRAGFACISMGNLRHHFFVVSWLGSHKCCTAEN